MKYNTPPYLFIIVFIIFIGWIEFVVFFGIGLVSLPMDLILDYFYRPQPRTAREIAERKVALRHKAEELIEYAKRIKEMGRNGEEEEGEKKGFFAIWKENRNIKNKEKKLQVEVYKLEQEYEIYEVEQELSDNPVWQILRLGLGIIFVVLSFAILLHILLFVLIVPNGQPAS